MEVNETITEVELDMEEDQLAMLSDEGRQAQWLWDLPKWLQGLQGLEGSFVCVKHV